MTANLRASPWFQGCERGKVLSMNDAPKITLAMLKAKRACSGQVKLFEETFGEGAIVTVARAKKFADKFAWVWAAEAFLTAAARAEYDRVTAPASAEYDRVTAPARAEYERITAAASAEYERITAPAWAEYDRVRATAFAECDRITATAWAEYDRATGPAGAEYDRVTATASAECDRITATAFATAYIKQEKGK